MSYHGKRAYAHHGHSSEMEPFQTLGRVLLFPLLLVYLELVLHIYMKTSLSYLPVYLVFSVAGGLFCGAFTLLWHRRANGIVTVSYTHLAAPLLPELGHIGVDVAEFM